jgi:hypothetical protein
VVRLARENSRWGYRIVGECRKLGVTVSATSVRSIRRSRRLGQAPRRDGPSLAEFLRGQAVGTIACDFLLCQPKPKLPRSPSPASRREDGGHPPHRFVDDLLAGAEVEPDPAAALGTEARP